MKKPPIIVHENKSQPIRRQGRKRTTNQRSLFYWKMKPIKLISHYRVQRLHLTFTTG
jgi:hypothetical protein